MLQMELVFCSGMVAAGGFMCMRWTRHPLHWSRCPNFRECCWGLPCPALTGSTTGTPCCLHPFVPEQRSLKVKTAQFLALLSALIMKSVRAPEQMLYKLLSLRCLLFIVHLHYSLISYGIWKGRAQYPQHILISFSSPGQCISLEPCWCHLISLLFIKPDISDHYTPCGLCVGSVEQHPAHVPCPSRLHFSASSAATLSFLYRAVFFLFLLNRHQCIAFPFKVNSTEPNFILVSVTIWNSAAQKWNTLLYSLLAQHYPVF